MPLYSAAKADRDRYTNRLLRSKAEEAEAVSGRRKSTNKLFQAAREEGTDLPGIENRMVEGAIEGGDFEQLQQVKKAFSGMAEGEQKQFEKQTKLMHGMAGLLIDTHMRMKKAGVPPEQIQSEMQEHYQNATQKLIELGYLDPRKVSPEYDLYELSAFYKDTDRIVKNVFGTEIRHKTDSKYGKGMVTEKDAWRAVERVIKRRIEEGNYEDEEELEAYADEYIERSIPRRFQAKMKRMVRKDKKKVTGGKQLDRETAAAILREANGDKNLARSIAKKRGYKF